MRCYLLRQPWILRSFTDCPYVLIDPTGAHENPVRIMVDELWKVLLSCDGRTLSSETRAHRVLLRHDIIESVAPGSGGLTEDQRFRPYPFPLRSSVQLSITGRCNLNCLHCFSASGKKRDQGEGDMTLEELLHVVDQFPRCGVEYAELTGGEPLLTPAFRPLVERLTQRHVSIPRLLTNGVLLDDEIFDFLEFQGQRPEIVISFDGLGTHNWQRNHPCAEEMAVEAMKRVVRRGFPLRCAVQVNIRTIARLVETCRFLKDLGAKSLYLIRTSETPRWAENTWKDESLPFTDYYEGCLQVAQASLREHWGVALQVFNGFYLGADPQPNLATSPPAAGGDSCAMRCGRAANMFFVSHDGYVWPCDAFEGIGRAGGLLDGVTLRNTPLEDILSNSAYTRIMAVTLDDIRRANEECGNCPHFAECGGGCRAFGYGSSMFHEQGYAQGQGRITKRAYTNCTFYRGGYADRVRELVEQARAETLA